MFKTGIAFEIGAVFVLSVRLSLATRESRFLNSEVYIGWQACFLPSRNVFLFFHACVKT